MLLKIDKASKTIKKKKVLDDVSAEFKSGLIYAVVGILVVAISYAD